MMNANHIEHNIMKSNTNNNMVRNSMRVLLMLLFWATAVGCESRVGFITATQNQGIVASPSSVMSASQTYAPQRTSNNKVPPTLTPNDAREEILELMETNADCMLPCWWGIDPRFSRWEDAVAFFDGFSALFARRYLDIEAGTDFFDIYLSPEGFFIGIDYTSVNDKIKKLHISTGLRNIETGASVYNSEQYFKILEKNTLDRVLIDLGKPSDIYFKSFYPDAEWFPSHTLLFYPEIGVLFEYESENDLVIVNNEWFVSTCPQQGFISLTVFDPSVARSVADLIEPGQSFDSYKAIEDVSDLSISDFYAAYKKPGCQITIITPAEIWPRR